MPSSKLDAYLRMRMFFTKLPTLEKLQVAEAKQRDLVQRVEKLKSRWFTLRYSASSEKVMN